MAVWYFEISVNIAFVLPILLHFQDPEWDGEPLDPEACKRCGNYPCTCEKAIPGDCAVCGNSPCTCEPEPCAACGQTPCVCKKKLKIKLSDGKVRTLQHMSATSFWDVNGKPITAAQFLENLFGMMPTLFKDEDELRAIWGRPDTRKELLGRLSEAGFGNEQLTEMEKLINAKDSDVYDVLAYVAFLNEPISREQRVADHKSQIFSRYDYKQQEFIEFILAQYVRLGVAELDQDKLPMLLAIKYGAISDAARALGSVKKIKDTFVGFQQYLYQERT